MSFVNQCYDIFDNRLLVVTSTYRLNFSSEWWLSSASAYNFSIKNIHFNTVLKYDSSCSHVFVLKTGNRKKKLWIETAGNVKYLLHTKVEYHVCYNLKSLLEYLPNNSVNVLLNIPTYANFTNTRASSSRYRFDSPLSYHAVFTV